MSARSATIAIVVILSVGGVLLLVTQARERDDVLVASNEEREELEALIAASNKERAALARQVESLNRRIFELELRQAVPGTAAAEAPRRAPVEVAAAVPVAEAAKAPPAPRVSTIAPAGWSKNGSAPRAYAVGVDQTQTHAGLPSAYVKSTEPSVDGFGGMMQMIAADEFVGKRVRYSAWVKTQDANEGGGHLWLRIDGNEGSMLGFDNMDPRPVLGTTDWRQYSIVLDVPAGAAALAYGFFVAGTGQMWVSAAKLEVVGPDVPTTNMKGGLPEAPQNLDFR